MGQLSELATFVCRHVAKEGLPILRARYDEPVDQLDSGWQFSCDVNLEDDSSAVLWQLQEVLRRDPSLSVLLNSARPGQVYVRQSLLSAWQLEQDSLHDRSN